MSLRSDVVLGMQFSIGHPLLGQKKSGELMELLYRKYINKNNPKYLVVYFPKNGVKVFNDIDKALEYLQEEFKKQGRELTIQKKPV